MFIRIASVRLLFVIVSIYKPIIYHMDDKTVFLIWEFKKKKKIIWSNPRVVLSELKNNFGPHDPEGKAEANLKNLKMRDNQCIVKYLVDFNCLAACVQWGDRKSVV